MKTTRVHQSLDTPTETDTQETAAVTDVNELKQHVTETWSATNSQQSFSDQAIDQW